MADGVCWLCDPDVGKWGELGVTGTSEVGDLDDVTDKTSGVVVTFGLVEVDTQSEDCM